VGEGVEGTLGTGYVSLVDSILKAAIPQQRIRITNMGISGNTVIDLRNRWQRDALDLAPDWLSIMIGINDVWRQFDSPLQPEWGVPLKIFRGTLTELVAAALPQVKGLILMTPYFIEPNRRDPMRVMMDSYGGAVKTLAEEVGAVLVDTQAAFDRVLTHLHPMSLAPDRVHPNQAGHMILARAFLNALSFEWTPE
jgi:lysophospholipase L1-like esterase